jgi:hypothetical protein
MADGDLKVLDARVTNLEHRVEEIAECVETNRTERRQDILNLSGKLDDITKSATTTNIELLKQFGLFKEELLKTVNGFMARLLAFAIPVLVGAVISLALFIYFSAPGHDAKSVQQVVQSPAPTVQVSP